VQGSQLDEEPLPARGQVDFHFPTIVFTRLPLDESPGLAARDERDHAVRLSLQTLGQLAHFGVLAPRKSLDVQKQQILQRRNAMRTDGPLGESLEASHLVTKLREPFEGGLGQGAVGGSRHTRFPQWIYF
jgi:hypothetical protein